MVASGRLGQRHIHGGKKAGAGNSKGLVLGDGQRHVQAGLGVVVVLRGGIGKAGS